MITKFYLIVLRIDVRKFIFSRYFSQFDKIGFPVENDKGKNYFHRIASYCVIIVQILMNRIVNEFMVPKFFRSFPQRAMKIVTAITTRHLSTRYAPNFASLISLKFPEAL